MPQLGSLGSGNHFVEVQAVDKIFDPKVSKVFGIDNDNFITLMIHCGSRGMGHQVASDFIRSMEKKYGYADLPDRELINAPITSQIGQKYVKAMNAAANFAFANKQLITHNIREEFSKIFGDYDVGVLYDICHNIAKFEKHKIDGSVKEVCVHRKGATRSFGPGRKELPEKYQGVGQPVLIPGSMGTSSYLLVGTEKAEEVSFASTAHGAGRVMSRNQAMRDFNKADIVQDLEKKKIYLRGASKRGIVEESPGVYKDVNEVVRVSDALGIGNLVVKVKPLGVIKG
jgi:tRNA-splicing ligase RtcB